MKIEVYIERTLLIESVWEILNFIENWQRTRDISSPHYQQLLTEVKTTLLPLIPVKEQQTITHFGVPDVYFYFHLILRMKSCDLMMCSNWLSMSLIGRSLYRKLVRKWSVISFLFVGILMLENQRLYLAY